MEWDSLYSVKKSDDSNEKSERLVKFADIGCGYGGLLG